MRKLFSLRGARGLLDISKSDSLFIVSEISVISFDWDEESEDNVSKEESINKIDHDIEEICVIKF